MSIDTSLSQTSSLGKVIIPPLLSFLSGFLVSVPSSIINYNYPILRYILVSAFPCFRTSSSLLFLVMFIQMLSKCLQVIELSIAVITFKDSDASIELWGIVRNVLGLLSSIDFLLTRVS